LKYGQVYSAGYGDPENACAYYDIDEADSYVNLRFMAAAGLGNAYYSIWRNSRLVTKVYVKEGVEFGPIEIQKIGSKNSILILREGQLADPGYMNLYVVRDFESATSSKFTLKWTWQHEVIGDPTGLLTAWTLTGLTPEDADPVIDSLTRGRLYYDLVVSGGNVDVTVRSTTTTLATGSGAFPGTIALAGLVSGSVDVGASAATASDNEFFVRWPRYMRVYRDTTDPPTSLRGTVYFDRKSTGTFVESSDLAAGTYYYRIRPYSDTDDAGTISGSVSNVLGGPPRPPSNLTYSSGNAAATVLGFNRSLTAGATYRLYLRTIGAAFVNLYDIAATAIAGTPGAAATINMPAVTGYPGTVRAMLRAVNGGTEEKGLLTLDIEYDAAGNRVAPRPNTPGINKQTLATVAGRTVQFTGTYPVFNEKGTGTHLQTFYRTPAGSYNFASPASTHALGSLDAEHGIKTAACSFTLPGNGWYYVTIKARTSGSVQSADYATEHLVYASDVDAAATTFEVFPSRG
jgi:hypothetical protein